MPTGAPGDDNGWTPPIERIGHDLDRIDDPHTANAIRTTAYAVNEARGDVMAKVTSTRDELRNIRRLLVTVLVALLGLIGTITYLAQQLGQAGATP